MTETRWEFNGSSYGSWAEVPQRLKENLRSAGIGPGSDGRFDPQELDRQLAAAQQRQPGAAPAGTSPSAPRMTEPSRPAPPPALEPPTLYDQVVSSAETFDMAAYHKAMQHRQESDHSVARLAFGLVLVILAVAMVIVILVQLASG